MKSRRLKKYQKIQQQQRNQLVLAFFVFTATASVAAPCARFAADAKGNIRQSVWFGLYEIDLIGYQGHVIPVIIAVWVM